ncbi:MAG: XdhC family protein [Beijerinckiaceae bacterium]
MKRDILSAMNAERAARRACIMVTELRSGAQHLVQAASLDALSATMAVLEPELRQRLTSGKSGIVTCGDIEYFFTVHVPPPRIVVTGAVHISQALEPMARMIGFDTTIIDPRMAFATPERFPGMRLLAEWPHEALQHVGLDRYTAFVALTHDPKIDDPGLTLALQSPCFYIGALGSRKTHARRIERFQAAGFTLEQIARIHAPIGLNIGALSPQEIALSILAEIVGDYRAEHAARKAA